MSLDESQLHFDTLALHAGQVPDPTTTALNCKFNLKIALAVKCCNVNFRVVNFYASWNRNVCTSNNTGT